jgi:acyl-CoA reductase-like NAD-dependent aldehyde dehydrogenase
MQDTVDDRGRADVFAHIERRFNEMHTASRRKPPMDAGARRAALSALRSMVVTHANEFARAICDDFGWRSPSETRMAEIVPVLTIITDALKHVATWMAPERRGRSVLFWPARNKVVWQPKGVVLIISPWNYPVDLAIAPLAAALAAGNRVILKPSEMTPRTSAALERRLEETLGSDRVTVATGGPEVAEALCRLPFDHILFTGSTGVGRKVMAAAAANLTPVTLELGGKSPAILHADYDLDRAVERIVRGKLLNAGQTCIAPDYALVPAARVDAFVAAFERTVAAFYPRIVDNPDYTAIINDRHYQRLMGLAADAHTKGARVVCVDPSGELGDDNPGDAATRKIAPAVLTGVTDAMAIMQNEIFGPLLPVVGYDNLDDAIAYVNRRPRPLALYYFDNDAGRIEKVLRETVSGGAAINETVLHFAQENLPFGGIGPSGMGAYHGRDGFRTFSHARGTFLQSRLTVTSLLTPPYRGLFDTLISFAIRRAGGRLWRAG